MTNDEQPWAIVQKGVFVFQKQPTILYCDRRLHLLTYKHVPNKNAPASSPGSKTSTADSPSSVDELSILAAHIHTAIYLERIHYIQRGDVETTRRSACRLNQCSSVGQHQPPRQQLEFYYSTDHPRSEYLYKRINFQLTEREDEIDKWLNALYVVINEAKNLNEAAKQNRWLLREYEKLKRSSGSITFDSINGWLNSHIGLVGEKNNIEKLIKQHEIYCQSNEITDSVFKTTYYYFIDKQQEVLIKNLMSDAIENKRILLKEFAMRVVNKNTTLESTELENILKFLRLDNNQKEISFKQCIDYLWSDANSAFDPISRTECNQDMDQPLNHYWISSSHNTYLAKTQIFNPASVHCYIQALLKGCRCIEIDVMDSRSDREPEITHKNTRIKPIPLRDVLLAINDYAFTVSEYPVIISIENHCSPAQRNIMANMFIEIFGESLIQAPLSSNETSLPSPNQLKRRIILKDSKINYTAMMVSQTSTDSDDQLDIPPLGLEGPVRLYDFAKQTWLPYNYSFTNSDLYLGKDDELQKPQSSDDDDDDDDFSDEESNEDLPKNELTQIWYHRKISHQDAQRLLLSNAGYEPGTFLVRKSVSKNCYCVTFLASDFVVKSIEINEIINEDRKCQYALSSKKFESIPDLVAHYRTYDFAEVVKGSTKPVLHRLGKPLLRATWRQELERQQWYQPNVTRREAEELLLGIGEEMTFLIRESLNRARQDYTISVYTHALSSQSNEDTLVHHSPIYRDGSDFMLMSLTFTSLIELVDHFSRKPIFKKLCLQKPAITYSTFIKERSYFEKQGIHKDIMIFKRLNHDISLKVDTLRTLQINEKTEDGSVEVQLYIYEEDKERHEGYFLKFKTPKDWKIFLSKIYPAPSSLVNSGANEMFGSTSSIGASSMKTTGSSIFYDQSQSTELDKLIIYCQGVKLKDQNINKPQELEKIRSFKEMISLNFVKAAIFCAELGSMILFNQSHFTRVYPDFSRKSWSSYNFDPLIYWFAGCQLVALNFQMPDRPMHLNAGRFAANGGCGYILMPKYIRSYSRDMPKSDTKAMLLKVRVVAVRHLRTTHAKSISKVQVKATIICKQRATDNQTCSTTINGPCGIWDSRHSSKHDQLHAYNDLHSENSNVDLLYFEVWTDNEGFCGQSAIPLSSLRPGIRSVHLYDKFNERLDMSALLVDLNFQAV